MTAREVMKILRRDGWYKINQEGSHVQFRHPSKSGKVTVSIYAGDIPPATLNSIFKQAGLK